jgi:hypothetical protein
LRYAESRFGEDSIALGEFPTGSTVTCILYNVSSGATIAVGSNACSEIGATGVFKYNLSNITTKPTSFTQVLYIMTDSTTGRTHKGKILVGGYPSDSAIRRYAGKITIDTVSGTAGTTFPIGTEDDPVSNVADAKTIADSLGFKTYHLNGSITLTVDHQNWNISGDDPAQDIVTVNAGVSVDTSTFTRVGVKGDLTGDASFDECRIGASAATTTGLSGIVLNCGARGTLRIKDGSSLRGIGLLSEDLGGTTISFNSPAAVTSFLVSDLVGIWSFSGMNSKAIVGCTLHGADVSFPGTHVNSTVELYGQGETNTGTNDYLILVDNVLKATTVENITSAVWEEPTSSHTTSGTFGYLVTKLLTVAKFLGLK